MSLTTAPVPADVPRRRTPGVAVRVTELIGGTPLFELARTPSGARLLLKLEQQNPTGAAKIRMAYRMVLDAEERGTLRPGGRIVESTSGNTGLGLAVVAAERGYHFTAVVDRHACADKLRAMQAMGAEIVYVSDEGDEELATAAREELAARLGDADDAAVFLEQHNNPANGEGYRELAGELFDDLGSDLHRLVGAVGTGGSLCGTVRELRRLGPTPRVVGVEPVGSIAFGGPGGNYYQSGTGTPEGAEIGALVDYDLIDEGRKVSDVDAFATARVVARRTGLLIGGSAGGVAHVALDELLATSAPETIVMLVCDGGEKYLDTVFNDRWMTERELLDLARETAIASLLEPLRACAEEQVHR